MRQAYIKDFEATRIGVPIIDEQHRCLSCIINSLFFFMRHDRGHVVLRTITRLLEQFIIVHYLTEETLLRLSEYPGLDEHRASHRRLMRDFAAAGVEAELARDPRVLLTFLKTWWVDHVNEEDRRFADHLIAWIADASLEEVRARLHGGMEARQHALLKERYARLRAGMKTEPKDSVVGLD